MEYFLGDWVLVEYFLGDWVLEGYFLGDWVLGEYFLGDWVLGERCSSRNYSSRGASDNYSHYFGEWVAEKIEGEYCWNWGFGS